MCVQILVSIDGYPSGSYGCSTVDLGQLWPRFVFRPLINLNCWDFVNWMKKLSRMDQSSLTKSEIQIGVVFAGGPEIPCTVAFFLSINKASYSKNPFLWRIATHRNAEKAPSVQTWRSNTRKFQLLRKRTESSQDLRKQWFPPNETFKYLFDSGLRGRYLSKTKLYSFKQPEY